MFMTILIGFGIFEVGVLCGVAIMCILQVAGCASRAEERLYAQEELKKKEDASEGNTDHQD